MELFISVDMEGITGVTGPEYLVPEGKYYERARRLMVHDVNAVVRAAREAGAGRITVNDAHNLMTNLPLEDLDPSVELISGPVKPLCMMQGVEGHEAAMLVGYHARMGTPRAVMDHTYYASLVRRILLNGREVGETGINAALAGHFGVPVILVSGDRAVGEEASSFIPGVETVVVKEAYGRNTARCLPPEVTGVLLGEGVRRALSRWRTMAPLKVGTPVCFEVEFFTSQMADQAEVYPYARRSGTTIAVTGKDMLEAFHALLTVLQLGRAPLL
ncbi:MAG: M55 family metallopeptidase [Bacillota bacterium]|nr:M55 family metallopeptidase [Bacillota bacterium]MDI7248676.1 M55 family metallopeptidase [Bacillota bacterium]